VVRAFQISCTSCGPPRTFGSLASGPQTDFYWAKLDTGQQRRLTNFKEGFLRQSIDITPDGKEITFDRVGENADIVRMDLAR
jgi:hypothetical protein